MIDEQLPESFLKCCDWTFQISGSSLLSETDIITQEVIPISRRPTQPALAPEVVVDRFISERARVNEVMSW